MKKINSGKTTLLKHKTPWFYAIIGFASLLLFTAALFTLNQARLRKDATVKTKAILAAKEISISDIVAFGVENNAVHNFYGTFYKDPNFGFNIQEIDNGKAGKVAIMWYWLAMNGKSISMVFVEKSVK